MRASLWGLGLVLIATGCVGGPFGGKKPLEADAAQVSVASSPDSKPPAELASGESARIHLALAEECDKQDKQTEAIAYYEKARQLDPAVSDRTARRLAVLYDQQDQQAKALTEFQELLKKNPKDANLLNDIGYSYYNRGNWVMAEDHLRRATAVDKKHKRAWVNLGLTLAQQGKYPDAITAFEKVVTPAEAQANLGFVLTTQGKRDEAKAVYQKALQLEPELKSAQAALDRLDGKVQTPAVVPASN